MSDQTNVHFVEATKKILKEMGIEVKTTQIYEMYSKLLGEKNWNVAKSKKIDFSKIIYDNHKLEDLVLNIENLDPIKVIEQLHNRMAKESNIEIVDYEDLLKLAKMIDNNLK